MSEGKPLPSDAAKKILDILKEEEKKNGVKPNESSGAYKLDVKPNSKEILYYL